MAKYRNLFVIGTDFTKVPNKFFDIFSDNSDEFVLLLRLMNTLEAFNNWDKLNEDKGFYLSLDRIVGFFNGKRSKPTILKLLEGLENKGFIKKQVINGRQANYYYVNYQKINNLCDIRLKRVYEKDEIEEQKPAPTKIIEIKTIELPCKNDEKEDIKNSWNEIAKKHELPKVRVVSEKNIKDIKQNIKEVGVSSIKEYFNEIDNAINNSDFLQGKNERGWKINFNFITQKSSMNKLFNNAYENTNNFLNNITKNESKALRRDAFIDELFKEEQKLIGH